MQVFIFYRGARLFGRIPGAFLFIRIFFCFIRRFPVEPVSPPRGIRQKLRRGRKKSPETSGRPVGDPPAAPVKLGIKPAERPPRTEKNSGRRGGL